MQELEEFGDNWSNHANSAMQLKVIIGAKFKYKLHTDQIEKYLHID